MVDIKVPSPGESITEGTLARWLKPNGSFVKMDEPVFELESDKAAIEVNAPAAGVLSIAVPEGSTVQVGAIVGQIDEKAKAPAAAPQPAPRKRTVRQTRNRSPPRRRPGKSPPTPEWTSARSPAADAAGRC